MGGKSGRKKLCPMSFGLAVGLTAGLAYFIWVLWAMYNGASPMMPVPTLQDGSIHALFVFIKGFLFGFFVALFYDWISCCCKMKCCKESDAGDKPEAGKL